jgi:TolA-binding protein
MSTNVLVTFCLTLTLGITIFYGQLREHFSPVHHLRAEVAHLNQRIREERFQNLLTSYQFADFKTEVATLLPGAIKEKGEGEKSFSQRMLASVVQSHSSDQAGFQRAQIEFEDGSRLFREKKYEEATRVFEDLIQHHPYSTDLPKAMFLIVESSFQTHQYDQLIQYANKMLDVYPDNELTGYALLRLGRIFEFQDRHQEAMDIYKTVIKTFPSRELASLADNALRAEQL